MIRITVDNQAFHESVDRLVMDQVPYAASRAINDLALEVQKGERSHVHSTYIVRNADYIDKSIKIPRFSKKSDPVLSVTIQVDPKRDVLNKFEEGGTKTSRAGGNVAIPVDARPSPGQIVPKSLRPKSLLLTQQGNRTIGAHGTFLITMANGKRAIMQRTRKGGVRLLYWLAPSVHIPQSLKFVETATKIIYDRWNEIFTTWLANSIASSDKPTHDMNIDYLNHNVTIT